MQSEAEKPACSDPNNLVSVFFKGPGLRRMLTYLCNARKPGDWDPVTATVLDLLTGRLQFCLSSVGLIPFRGKASLVYPYHMMTAEQKDFLRQALQDRASFCVCNEALVFHNQASQHRHDGFLRHADPSASKSIARTDRLDQVPVLQAMCQSVLESKIHEERRVKIGICNILLQRVQSVVPIARSAQLELNSLLFQ